jgi:hypothetical protein
MFHITIQKTEPDKNENCYRTGRNKGGRKNHRISDERQLKGKRTKGRRKFAVRRGDVETITEGKGVKRWGTSDERKS